MKKSAGVFIQSGYWLLYGMLLAVLFFILTLFQRPPMYFGLWCRIMIGFAIIPGVAGFYSSYFFLFPYYLKKKNLFRVALLFAGVSALAALAGMFSIAVFVNAQYLVNDGIPGALGVAVPLIFIAFVNASIGFIIKGFESWFRDKGLREELIRKNHDMELALVKSQIDPHFLFNTINNIDILIEKDRATASGYLNKLSDIMRFMLYETKANRIPLAKELTYIEKYIALQKIRTTNIAAIQYVLQGDPGAKTIAPMVFIPFIENAFKHANLKVGQAVRIGMVILEKSVEFECSNLIGAVAAPDNISGGIGKDLIEKRLSLLYPDKHHLAIHRDEQYYHVKLTIEHEN